MKRVCLLITMLAMFASAARAETDFMEAAAPPGPVFQVFQLYQNSRDFARDEIPLKDLDLDAAVTLLRPAWWWEGGVVHAIVPVGYVDQSAHVFGTQEHLFSGEECGLGDIYLGGAKRWIGQNKDWYFLAGGDVRLPTGDYESDQDPFSQSFSPFGGFNFGSGSLSLQPFVILTKMYKQGFFAHDTEVRFDLNTSAGPIDYNPDDKIEFWQTAHFGVTKNLRLGAALKAEQEVEDDDGDRDHANFLGIGPEAMYAWDNGVVLWAKVIFGVCANDYPEDLTTIYLRLSIPFGPKPQ
jgi:hypothetical protein